MAFACLMYHSLADGRHPDALYPKYTTTRELFRAHLDALQADGFTLGSFADLLRHSRERTTLPAKFCALTFDDGHKSSLDIAEILSEAGARGTFFLTLDYCRDRADFLKPGEIRELAARGFDFGTHGVSHRGLADMPESEMRLELSMSRRWLEDILGTAVTTMSLPAGRGSARVSAAAFEMGYELLGNSVEQTNGELSLPSEINRFVIWRTYTPSRIRQIAAGSRAYIAQRRLRSALLALPKRVLRTYDRTRG